MQGTTGHQPTGGAKITPHTTIVGVDIAKQVLQLHWVERETGEIKGLKLTWAKFLAHVAYRAPCQMAMEACGGTPHWGRPRRALGHKVKRLPAKKGRPFVSDHKHDTQGAQAIWTAAHHPDIQEVAIKREVPQAVWVLPSMRQPLMTCRTA